MGGCWSCITCERTVAHASFTPLRVAEPSIRSRIRKKKLKSNRRKHKGFNVI